MGKGGAFTGEISAEMLYDMGIPWVILGHSGGCCTLLPSVLPPTVSPRATLLGLGRCWGARVHFSWCTALCCFLWCRVVLLAVMPLRLGLLWLEGGELVGWRHPPPPPDTTPS